MEALFKSNVNVNRAQIIIECFIGSKHNRKYFPSDPKLISEAKNDEIAKCLSVKARNKDSLNSGHHEQDMKDIIINMEEELSKVKEINQLELLRDELMEYEDEELDIDKVNKVWQKKMTK